MYRSSPSASPFSPSGDARFTAALEEYRALLETGAKPNREEFVAAHAELGPELADCLAGLEFVLAAAGNLTSPSGSALDDSDEIGPFAALGDFRILREIGRGGMGIVYEAEQLSLSRRIALKVLPFAATMDPRNRQCFKNEALAAAQLDHPHIVDVYGVGCERGVHYYAMRLIEGQTLAAAIAQLQERTGRTETPLALEGEGPGVRGSGRPGRRTRVDVTQDYTPPGVTPSPTPPERCTQYAVTTPPVAALSTENSSSEFFRTVAGLAIQAAEALEHAHAQGVIHRDIKPSNLMLDAQGKLGLPISAWPTSRVPAVRPGRLRSPRPATSSARSATCRLSRRLPSAFSWIIAPTSIRWGRPSTSF